MTGLVMSVSSATVERPVSREMVEFCRREQMQRLKAFVSGRKFVQSVSGRFFLAIAYWTAAIEKETNYQDIRADVKVEGRLFVSPARCRYL